MKSVKKISLPVLAFMAFVVFTTMNVGEAYGQGTPVYLGEHCWEGGGGFLRLGLTHMGDRHVSFGGLVTDDLSNWAINGNLEVVGNSILVTSTEATTSLGSSQMMSRVAEAVLDLATLDGTASFMEMTWEGGVGYLDHYSFDITYVNCGTGLPSDGVDKRDELIRFLSKYSTTPEENQE